MASVFPSVAAVSSGQQSVAAPGGLQARDAGTHGNVDQVREEIAS